MRRDRPDPIVLEDCNISHFIHFLIKSHAVPTNLIICSSRETFLQDLIDELNNPPTTASASEQEQHQDDTGSPPEKRSAKASSSLQALLLPTLDILSASSTVTVAFCPDLTHLLANLSLLQSRDANSPSDHPGHGRSDGRPVLAILNPIRLHKPTSSFSAQGFNRTFASAVECAHRRGQQLILAEIFADADVAGVRGYDGDVVMHDEQHLEEGALREGDVGQRTESPWEEQLSMLNVTTKTFGVGQRGWVGRTVTVRQVAGRWCRFVRLGEIESDV